MKVAIIVAMEEELKPVLEKFASNDKKNFKKEKYFKNIFYKVKFKNIEIIIVKSGIGKINSTITATQVIEKFGVDKVFFSGVAGALKKDLKIGDIVLAEKIAQ
jgi:adenosylhomocysteine/aminodeoxyfutalosine nucleosidase